MSLRIQATSPGPTQSLPLLSSSLLIFQGAERTRRHMLSTVPIVGVTCYSSMLPALDGQVFAVVRGEWQGDN